ncbi:MAG TPA: hypothetical protein VFP56_08520 [Candidatus Limnocylindrales bacterium]|nr:hypothetical protein [Candidatus Limnocylindrales bacterium]
MERRLAPLAALVVVLALGGVALGATPDPAVEPLSAVTWPASTLLVSEVQTGGASASDEFAEITNVGGASVDLVGLELVYVTSTGSTVTRKASWSTPVQLEPGRHLLVANSGGIYAAVADATYSSGFAATGGTVVLRAIGGAPVDAVGWGDATNDFVEDTAAQSPPAGSSIERKPGGLSGNTLDSNVNAADFLLQASPNPQSLAAPPVPFPGGTPTVEPTVEPSMPPTVAPTSGPTSPPTFEPTFTPLPSFAPTPDPTDDPTPTAPSSPTPTVAPSDTTSPTSSPTPTPVATTTPSPPPTPTPTPSPTPTPTSMPTTTPTSTPLPTPSPTPTPVPTPTPEPIVSIAEARGLGDGAAARITGVLTTDLGALEAGRKAFVQDGTGGIAVYLDVAVVGGLSAGTLIIANGTVDERFAERTLRVALVDIVVLGEQPAPAPLDLATGEIGEANEGSRAIVQGLTVGSPSELSDGLGLLVDDGSGAVRVIVGADALAGASVPSGTSVVAIGPVGQRDSSGTGLAGYRIHVTEADAFVVLPAPSPSPTPAPTSTPVPTATTSPTATPTPRPSAAAPTPTPAPTRTPTPTATPAPTAPPTITIVEARGAPIGVVVSVTGVVIAEAGRLGLPPIIAIADGTGGIAVRLPDGTAAPSRGTTVSVKGPLADPYGQLEVRPPASGFKVTGQGSLPAPGHLEASDLGEATEGRLAELSGTVAAAPKKSTSGDLTIDLTDAEGKVFRILTDVSSGIEATDLVKGRSYRLTGVVGQRASRKGALDGYRLYVRDPADVVSIAGLPGAPSTSTAPGARGAVPISTVLAAPEGTTLTIEATVTAGHALLDSSGRRIVVQDSSGAIEVLVPSGSTPPKVGTKVRVSGRTGLAWGAPRIGATSLASVGSGNIAPANLNRAPGARDEWLLVRMSGTVLKVERLGDRWRADVTLANGTRVAVNGQAGAAIPSTAVITGRRITVMGIVKRPYPTASDRRFAVLPRSAADVAIAPVGSGAAVEPLASTSDDAGSTSAGGTSGTSADVTPDTDLAVLSEHVGERVRVGGLIASVSADGFDLDDGTALAHVELRGDMAELLPHLRAGEAVAASGIVALVDGTPIVVVDEHGSLLRVGALGQAIPIGPVPSAQELSGSTAPGAAPLAADSVLLSPGMAPTSVFVMALLTLASVLMTLLRRRLARRRLRAVVVERLATLRPSRRPTVAEGPPPAVP